LGFFWDRLTHSPMAQRSQKLVPWLLSGSLLLASLGLAFVKLRTTRAFVHPPRPIEMESPNQQHLTAARAALAEKKLAAAHRELSAISPDTAMSDPVAALRRALQELAEAHVREAKELIQRHQFDEAQARVDEVLEAFPENTDAQELSQGLQLQQAEAADPRAAQPGSKTPQERAAALFTEGKLSEAASLADTCASASSECKELLRNIQAFMPLYGRLKELTDPEIARLVDLDIRIGGPKNPTRALQNTGREVARRFYVGAEHARADKQWARTVEYAQRAVMAGPGHHSASRLLGGRHRQVPRDPRSDAPRRRASREGQEAARDAREVKRGRAAAGPQPRSGRERPEPVMLSDRLGLSAAARSRSAQPTSFRVTASGEASPRSSFGGASAALSSEYTCA
jgi:tetratricopeptide (TPR) repeat protein